MSKRRISSVFSKYSQSIVFSAPRAVFAISLLGGLGVCPHKISLENQAPSAFLNIAPTFCIERSESSKIIFSFINFYFFRNIKTHFNKKFFSITFSIFYSFLLFLKQITVL